MIVKRNIEIGSAFNPGDILATIVDTHRLTVELEVPEGEISKVKPKDIVHVKIAGFPEPVIGSVDVIVPTIDSGTRTSKIRLKNIIINNGSIESLVTADLELMGQSEKALIIPQSALVFYKNKHYVLKRTNQDPEIVPVQILTEMGTTSLVRADEGKKLTENDEILQEGAIFIFNKLHGGILK